MNPLFKKKKVKDCRLPEVNDTKEDPSHSENLEEDLAEKSVKTEDHVMATGEQVSAVNADQVAVLGDFQRNDDQDVDHFFLQVQLCREAFGCSQAVTAQIVQIKLKGEAGRWLRSELTFSSNDDHDDEWEVIRDGSIQPNVGLRFFLLQRFMAGMNGRGAVADLRQKAGIHKDMRRQVMGGPKPTSTRDLQIVARNAEL